MATMRKTNGARSRMKGKSLFPGADERWSLMTPSEVRKEADALARAMRCSRSNAVSHLIRKYARVERQSGVHRDPATGKLVEAEAR